jgi:XTP/dITP diphosphohydrolase
MTKVVLATSNPGKLREMRTMLQNMPWEIVAQNEFDCPDATEDGLSFVENAIKKARHACAYTGLPSIADDSGLEVDALLGAPGIYSARYSGADASDEKNIHKLLQALKDVPSNKRSARFRCVLVYMRHDLDPSPLICEGSWEGRIASHEQGENGFGYDPIFYVPTYDCSSAQLCPDKKNSLSHRGQALRALADTLAVTL